MSIASVSADGVLRAADPGAEAASEPLVRPVARRRLAAFGWMLILAAVLLAYSAFLSLYYAPAIIHPDANGYWAQGSLIWQTGHSWFTPQSDAQYVGMHWLMLGDGENAGSNTFVSRYPPGFPLAVGLVQKLFGWRASVLVNPVLAVGALAGVYLALRLASPASPAWGILAIVVLAANPAFTIHALTQISHMAVAFCVVWGFYFLIRWADAGYRLRDVFLAGLVLGCIPSIRYADSVVAIGVALFLLAHVRSTPRVWKHYLAALCGAMVPIVPLLVRNQLLFGAFWKTGYALTNEQTGFSWQNFLDHAVPYLQTLQGGGLGLMFGLGIVGLIWMLFIPRTRAVALLFTTAAAPFLAVYMAYYWALGITGGGGGPGGGGGGGGNVGGAMRFLVPIVPLFVIAGTWLMAQALAKTPRSARVAIPLVVVGLQILLYGPALRSDLRRSFQSKATLALATRELEQVAPEGSLVVADPALLQHLDFVRKWKLADPSIVTGRGRRGAPGAMGPGGMGGGAMRGIGGAGSGGDQPMDPFRGGGTGGGGGRAGGFPGGFPGPGGDDDADDLVDLPSPMQIAKNQARARLYPGTEDEKLRKFERDINTWAGKETDIFIVARESDLSRLMPLADAKEFEIVRRITVPSAPQEPESRRPAGRAGRGFAGGGGPGGPGGGRIPRGPGGGGGGGPFGAFLQSGETFVIARWVG